jgi:hypothetical protein
MAIESYSEPLRIMAHIVSSGSEGLTGRLTLEDSSGFSRAVLAVGYPQKDVHGAIESAVAEFERKLKSIS